MPWSGTVAELNPAFLQPVIKKRAKKKPLVHFTTAELRRLNSRLTETLDEIFLMTDNIIKESLAEVSLTSREERYWKKYACRFTDTCASVTPTSNLARLICELCDATYVSYMHYFSRSLG